MGWVSADRSGLTLAFLPEQISPEQRDDVVANDGVYPVLAFRQPMLEVHMALSAPQPVPDRRPPARVHGAQAQDGAPSARVRRGTQPHPSLRQGGHHDLLELRGADAGDRVPPGRRRQTLPRVRLRRPEGARLPLDLSGFDGLLKRGGWAVGAVRSNALYQSPGNRPEPYYVNLQFETSLG